MKLDLSGRRALVTGGANGIGRAISEALAVCGAEVFVLDLQGEKPAERAAEFGATGMDADVTDPGSLAAAFAAAGPLDVVVANAGTVAAAALTATTTEDWDRTLRVNLSGAFHTMKLAAEQMKPRRRGAIVLTASTNSYDGEPDLSAYNATKAGLLGLLHTAAGELGPYGIRVNAVCPGLIRTRLTAGHFSQGALLKEYFRHIPLGRGGRPEEVANAVAFLASGLASFITGAALLIDGGQMATKFGTWNEASAEFVADHWELK
ncbi:MAG TPA: SDR family NAD(P)-dependent oxidoreductase [Paludibaculum sp.]|jgi:NAD(P)-dependent dehydrogenase (short-subunit alcohol dehydrogenase family)